MLHVARVSPWEEQTVKQTAVVNTAIKEAEKLRALVRKASDEYIMSRISSTDCYLDSCWKCQESKDKYKRWRGDEGKGAGKVCGHAHG
jgi:hypothetical protein